jgi:hypothetical protein
MYQLNRPVYYSSAIAPALPYYRPSLDICKTGTSTIHGGRNESYHGVEYAILYRLF